MSKVSLNFQTRRSYVSKKHICVGDDAEVRQHQPYFLRRYDKNSLVQRKLKSKKKSSKVKNTVLLSRQCIISLSCFNGGFVLRGLHVLRKSSKSTGTIRNFFATGNTIRHTTFLQFSYDFTYINSINFFFLPSPIAMDF